jgi:hypothetical protein
MKESLLAPHIFSGKVKIALDAFIDFQLRSQAPLASALNPMSLFMGSLLPSSVCTLSMNKGFPRLLKILVWLFFNFLIVIIQQRLEQGVRIISISYKCELVDRLGAGYSVPLGH